MSIFKELIIDNFRLWEDRVLNQEEVLNLYNNGFGLTHDELFFDLIPPTLSIISPSIINTTVNSSEWDGYIQIHANETITNCTIDNLLFPTSVQINTTDWYFENITSLPDSTYNFFINCTNTHGNLGNISFFMVLDNTITEPDEPTSITITEVNIEIKESIIVLITLLLWSYMLWFALKHDSLPVFYLNSIAGIFIAIWLFTSVDGFPTIVSSIYGLVNGYLLVVAR